jgi:cellulase (glycosyl hydrolase family 5)
LSLITFRKLVLPSFTALAFTIITLGTNISLLSQYDFSTHAQQEGLESLPAYLGVAMRGNHTSAKEHDTSDILFPRSYYEDSIRLIHDAGMNHIRYLFYWESYAKNPFAFMEEITTVAETADRYGIKVLYDNHQWHTSSWLESRGTGFPSILFAGNPAYERDSGGNTDDETAKLWWTDWWNREVKDTRGNDGWTLQAEFLRTIVRALDRYESTLGYEILSEPQVHSDDQWQKIGTFNSFITSELRKETQKIIAYSQQVPSSFRAPGISVTSENQAKMAPMDITNVVFKISVYGPSSDSFQRERLSRLVTAAQIAQVPVYVGEWNNVVRERSGGVFQIDPEQSDLSQEEVAQFIEDFNNIGAWGWAYWQWNFNTHDVPNFNLVLVSPEGMIQPTKYYEQLKVAISELRL